jgi:hypothetical protein
VLQWLRANGCPWNSMVCDSAAEFGHNAVLQWALANGCPEYLDEPDEDGSDEDGSDEHF